LNMAKTIAFTDEAFESIVAAARAAGRFVGRGAKSQLGAFVIEAARAYRQPKPARKCGRGVAASRRRARPE
jgi:hypothetical protein